jgi:hypothetical protein
MFWGSANKHSTWGSSTWKEIINNVSLHIVVLVKKVSNVPMDNDTSQRKRATFYS